MTEQALIESIVAQVMSRLMTAASTAPSADTQIRGVRNAASIRLDAAIVTEDTLEASVNGHSAVEVGERTIVTPTGRDWLRRRQVELLRGKSSVATVAAVKAGGESLVIVQTSSEAVERVLDHFTSTAGWRQERVGSRDAAVRLATDSVRRSDASQVVVFSAEPEAIACEANRIANVRAAVINDVAGVGRVRKSMQGNLFAVAPAERSFFELRYLLHSLV